MVELILGIMAAVGASTLYSLGFAYQAMEARRPRAGVPARGAGAAT